MDTHEWMDGDVNVFLKWMYPNVNGSTELL